MRPTCLCADRFSDRSIVIATVITLLLTLTAGCGGGIPIDEKSVFQAKSSITPATFDRNDAQLKETFFGDEPTIHGWHIDRTPSRCTTLFFGGQGFHMVLGRRRIEAMLDDVPVDLFMFDYRGYGRSGGEATVEGLKSDALDAHDHLVDEFGADCIVAHGHSLGTFLATWLATKRDLDALVLEAPVVSARRFVNEIVPWYLRLFIGFDIDPAFKGENNAKRLANIRVPTLLIAGQKDEVAPPSHARYLHKKAAGNPTDLTVLETGTHNDLYLQQDFPTRYHELLCHTGRCGDDDD